MASGPRVWYCVFPRESVGEWLLKDYTYQHWLVERPVGEHRYRPRFLPDTAQDFISPSHSAHAKLIWAYNITGVVSVSYMLVMHREKTDAGPLRRMKNWLAQKDRDLLDSLLGLKQRAMNLNGIESQ